MKYDNFAPGDLVVRQVSPEVAATIPNHIKYIDGMVGILIKEISLSDCNYKSWQVLVTDHVVCWNVANFKREKWTRKH